MQIVHFMESGTGRLARIVAGLALVVVGTWQGAGWWALVALGAVFVVVGLWGRCLAAPLFDSPLRRAKSST